MKLSAKQWQQMQEALAKLQCLLCFSKRIELSVEEGGNAKCQDCSCKFKFNPKMAHIDGAQETMKIDQVLSGNAPVNAFTVGHFFSILKDSQRI